MYKAGGDSKPEEKRAEMETFTRFREWIKAEVICFYEVYEIYNKPLKQYEKRQKCKSIGDYTLKDGTTAISMIKAYIDRSGMCSNSGIMAIINEMEAKR
jgi:hypothetical protein